MSSPRQINFAKFFDLCQTQITGCEWMTQWPGEIDLKQAASVLRPLALEFRQAQSLTDEEVLACFFSAEALAMLSSLRNMYGFFVIAQEAGKHIGDTELTISLQAVFAAMEAKPEIPKSLVV